MAVTAVLVNQRPNRLRYLVTQDGNAGTTLTITTTGAASPDLLTDTLAGQLRLIAKAFTQGYGVPYPAGALTQAQARALWLSRGSGDLLATARCTLTPRTGTVTSGWNVDANVDGSGHPTVVVESIDAAGAAPAACTAYLDIELMTGAIGA